jgi:hypothetical protein
MISFTLSYVAIILYIENCQQWKNKILLHGYQHSWQIQLPEGFRQIIQGNTSSAPKQARVDKGKVHPITGHEGPEVE